MVITEGASTTDINAQVKTFIDANTASGIVDPTNDTEGECTATGLMGSTYLDDLTYFARNADASVLYPDGNVALPSSEAPFDMYEKNNLTTHFVVAGSMRDNGTGECNPKELMLNAAANGGTEKPVLADNPAKLEEQLPSDLQRPPAASLRPVRRLRLFLRPAAVRAPSTRRSSGRNWFARMQRQRVQGELGWRRTRAVHRFLRIHVRGHRHDRTLDPSEDIDNDGRFDCGDYELVDGELVVKDCAYRGDDTGSSIQKWSDGPLDKDGILDPEKTSMVISTWTTVCEDINDDGVWKTTGDHRVVIYYDQDQQKSRACYNTSVLQNMGEACLPATPAVDLEKVRFLWSAGEWLSNLTNDQTQTNRSLPISDESKRYIFTWNDMNHDGVVNYATGEVLDLVANPTPPSWNTLAKDFSAVDGYELNNIISWLRGKDWIYDEDLDGDGAWDANETIDYDANDGPRPREPYRSRKTVESGTSTNLPGDWVTLSIPPHKR